MIQIVIANPTYDLTFKDLFGPQGEVVNQLGPKERLISFLNSIYPEDKISDIQYINTINEQNMREKTIFDIACRCFDSNEKYICDIEIQRSKNKDFYDRTVLYASQSFIGDTKQCVPYNEQPRSRVLSILNFIIDENRPEIFNAYMTIEQTNQIISDIISCTCIQLPIIQKKGTANQWLQILSTGTNDDLFNQLNVDENSLDPACLSGLQLLKSYSSDNKKEQLKYAQLSYFHEQAQEASNMSYAKQEGVDEYREQAKMILNKNNVLLILNAYSNGKNPDEIAEFLLIPKQIVTMVLYVSKLAHNYIQLCNENEDVDPDYETFSKEAQNILKNVSQETIDLIVGT